MVKGLKSMWRQAPPIVRNTLQGVLARIIMQARHIRAHSHGLRELRKKIAELIEQIEMNRK
jgi:hypothetical protein